MNTITSFCLFVALLSASQIIIESCDAKVLPLLQNYNAPLQDVIHDCRKTCIFEILGDSNWDGQLMTYFRCRGKPNCFMCWDYCRAVNVARVDLAKSMCNDSQYCLGGCKIACNYYQTKTIYDVIDNVAKYS